MRKILAQYPLRRLGRAARRGARWCCCSLRPCHRGPPVRSFRSTAGTRCRERRPDDGSYRRTGAPQGRPAADHWPRDATCPTSSRPGPGTWPSCAVRMRHARIDAVDASRARGWTGVRAVFTGGRFLEATVLRARSALPGYAETDAAGAGRSARPASPARWSRRWWRTDRYLAEDALALIDVDYAPLPVTVTAWGRGQRRQCTTRPRITSCSPGPSARATPKTPSDVADLLVKRELITNRHDGQPDGGPSRPGVVAARDGVASLSGPVPRSRTSSATCWPNCSAWPRAASRSSRPTWAAASASSRCCTPRMWRCA